MPGQGRTSGEQPAHLLNLSGPRCAIGCLVGEGDVCDQHKQISEGRTELHVEWTHVVLRGGPIISCDLCSYLFPQENGSA